MSDDGKVNGEPDPRLTPVFRVVVEIRDGKVNVQGNLPPEGCIRALTDGIVAMARHMAQEKPSLIKPVGAVPPPLRRIP